jgi:hypothetical protein
MDVQGQEVASDQEGWQDNEATGRISRTLYALPSASREEWDEVYRKDKMSGKQEFPQAIEKFMDEVDPHVVVLPGLACSCHSLHPVGKRDVKIDRLEEFMLTCTPR